MDKLEKVIKALECVICPNKFCGDCSYFIRNENDPDTGLCNRDAVYKDALSLLKAQEPVKPYIDYDGQDVWRCGSCGATLFHLSYTQADENEQNCVKFCRYCGKAVEWE